LAEAEADAEARHLPKEISSTDTSAMRAAYETKYGELADKDIPARSYMEKKLDEVEKSEYRAELLTEVISRDEGEPDNIKPVWTANMQLCSVKVGTKVSLPTDTESLRKRLALLGTAWLFVQSHQAGRGFLRGITPALFQEYTSYLLGDYVLGLVARNSGGGAVAAPSWSLLISYEHAIRVKSMQLIRKGALFPAALKAAWEDALTKERHFTTPLALESVKYASAHQQFPPGNWGPEEPARKKLKLTDGTVDPYVGGKGTGTGKSEKKKGRQGKKATFLKTAEGQAICFHYNKGKGCSRGAACKFAHACNRCGAPNVLASKCTCPH
jgi:hypothetical protein